MIQQHTCFTAHCDECKNAHESDEFILLHYDSAEQAVSEAEGCDWVSLSDGRLICDRCIRDLITRGKVEKCQDDDHEHAYHLVTEESPR